MNDTLNRLKKLAGLTEATLNMLDNAPINVNARVRTRDEYTFHSIARDFGATHASINDDIGRTVGRATFQAETATETKKLSEAFIKAWAEFEATGVVPHNKDNGVVNEEEAVTAECSIEAPNKDIEAKSQEESTETVSEGLEGPFTFKNGTKYYYVTNESAEYGAWSTIQIAYDNLNEGASEDNWLLYSGPKGSGTLALDSCGATQQICEDEFTASQQYDENNKEIKKAHMIVKAPKSGPIPATMVEAEDLTNFTQQIQADDNKLSTRTGADADRAVVVKIPKAIKDSVAKRIKELEASIEQYDEKGYNEVSQKEKAIKCLNQIMDNLAVEDIEGVKQAQIFFGTLMSPITDLFPAPLVTFLAAPTYGYDTKSGWLDKFK